MTYSSMPKKILDGVKMSLNKNENFLNVLRDDFLFTAVTAGLTSFFIMMSIIVFFTNGSLLAIMFIIFAIYEGWLCYKTIRAYKNMRAQNIPKKEIEAFNRMNPTT